MSLNGVNSNYQAYETNTVSGSDKKVSTKEISKTTAYSGVAATYEHASQSEGLVAAVNKKASNASIVAQLKADQETRMAQMQSLVTKMFSKQGITIGTADDMWKALAGGNFTADADTIARLRKIFLKTVTGVLNRHLKESSHLHRHSQVMMKKR